MIQRQKEFKAVLFDLDGTLIEFKFPIEESRRALIDFLKTRDYDVELLNNNTRTQDLIDTAKEQWATSPKLKKAHSFVELRENLYRILDSFEFDSIKASKPLAGCLDVIRKLNEAGILTGIVTNSGRAAVNSRLSEYGYLPYMKVVITRDEMTRMKPRPDGLLVAKNMLQLNKDDLLYVGDSILDIEAAQEAGIRLRKMRPDFLLRSLDELEGIFLLDRS
ncbi:MAG: HAD-IA family hydrolase [Nitrososphaerota archaeon]|nr:HAD-IA family hydrolase [Nitrososphaerota archaeon]